MKNIWFTSDTHFDHANIIRYCNRPFSNVDEMNETIIKNWNSLVKPDDDIYHLGDFSMSKDWSKWFYFLSRLNGNIYLIRGNHDNKKVLDILETKTTNLVWVKDYFEFSIANPFDKNKIVIIMMHYAMRVWNRSHHGSFHLYGHSHGGLTEDSIARSMDIGVDTNNFKPYSLEEIYKRLSKKTGYVLKK